MSCDILPSDSSKGPHHQGDVIELLNSGQKWDLIIAHPPCTYLALSGARWLYTQEGRWDKLEEAASFFSKILNTNAALRVAVENPIMLKYGTDIIGTKHTQAIQPWQFGHMEKKSTCLWLRNLPKLVETDNVKEKMSKLPKSEQNKIHYMAPGPERAKLRSTTYKGIAEAMADQWGELGPTS